MSRNDLSVRYGCSIPDDVGYVMLDDGAPLNVKWVIAFFIMITACAALAFMGLTYVAQVKTYLLNY